MHLANSSYIKFTSNFRSEYLNSIGIGVEEIKNKQIRPIVYHENISYFKEVLPHSKIYVTFQIVGLSESGDMFEFMHNFYDLEGNHLAKSYMIGCWINLKDRKLTKLPENWINALKFISTKNCRVLTKEILKTLPHQKTDIDVQMLNLIY